MLRAFVLVLLLANLAFYAWTQGWLDNVIGVRATGDREPERLERQLRPELVKVLTPQAVAAAASAAAERLVCLEAGPFSAVEASAAEATLAAALPAGSWANLKTDTPATWLVYMGKYANRDAQQKKEEELARANVPFEAVKGVPELEPGISLGRFDDRAAADAALLWLTQRGVRSAKVIEFRKASVNHMLRVDRADAELAAKVAGLKADVLGQGFGPCGKP
ncbi:SPOR domain-containing protein [Piscinibacter sp.]|uniref:SPOR domain-containing protein n=1 Tax=Piscinibacter sp. TaxID=1903157 RepID=UPI0035594BFF